MEDCLELLLGPGQLDMYALRKKQLEREQEARARGCAMSSRAAPAQDALRLREEVEEAVAEERAESVPDVARLVNPALLAAAAVGVVALQAAAT